METIERLRASVQIQRERIGPRIIVSIMVFVGFVISGVIEHSITVALLRKPNLEIHLAPVNLTRRYCDPPNMTALSIYYDSSEELDDLNYDFSQLQEMDFKVSSLSHNQVMESILKKSFYWGYLLSPLAASRLAANIGPKRVFGYGLLGSGAATLLVPAAWLSPAHMVIRFAQGLFYGAMLPSAHMLSVNWFPPNKRSTLLSMYSGVYIGYATSEALTLRFMKVLGHDSVFYIMSLLVMTWFVLWSLLVFNVPAKHPRLSLQQKKKIEGKAGCGASAEPLSLPWRNVLTSRAVWMSVAVTFGTHVGQAAVNIGFVQYLEFVYDMSDSTLTALSCLLHSVFAVLCGQIVDYMRQTGLVSTTSSRRMFVYISHFILAAFVFVVGYVGCDTTAPSILYALSVITSGAAYSGAYGSSLDISPNFAGTIFGLCCTAGAVGNLLTSYFVSEILKGKVPGSWRMFFSLCSLNLLLTAIFFMLRGSGRVQDWNFHPSEQQQLLASQPVLSRSMSDSPGALLRAKHKLNMEGKILKVLHVQEPEKLTRVRAYSTSTSQRMSVVPDKCQAGPSDKKRASIS